jgi:hypothetical protein
VVAIVCEVEGDALTARWVQLHPAKFATLLGTEQTLVQPKTVDGITVTVRIPEDLTPVHTDVRLPIVTLDLRAGKSATN